MALLLVPCTAGLSQDVFKSGIGEVELLSYSTRPGLARYSYHILSMGDMNRDGEPDLFIDFINNGAFNTWLLFGKGDGSFDLKNYLKLEGWGTLATGDVNGDSLPDLLVQSSDESVTMYPGCAHCPFAIDTIPAWRIFPDIDGYGVDEYGEFIETGDLNGDGREDIVVAAPMWYMPDSVQEHGKLFIYFGGSSRFPQPDLTAVYPVPGQRYAQNGVRIADVHGDGYKDLIVGSSRSTSFYQYIDVFRGGPGFTVDPLHPDQRLGREIIPYSTNILSMQIFNILDMNNDGTADLFITDHYGYTFYGRPEGFASVPDRVIVSPDSVHYRLGAGLFDIGDVNGDGFVDYLHSGYWWGGGSDIGMGLVYLGGPQGMDATPVSAAFNPASYGWFGFQAMSMGYANGDSYRDFVVGYIDGSWAATGFAVYAGKGWKRTAADTPPAPTLPGLTAFPNPFRDLATITAAGDMQRGSALHVFDVFGRELRRIATVGEAANEATFFWDGRDARGAAVPDGVYYCALETRQGLLKGMMIKR